ncbi:MAG: NAD-dependent epimerase/dehydratase family protein [Candidatus Aminicenantes bacterium]|nr:NAD-dependent epimerase/dehydratase family protein [Candidatus Aminicenantes bacterium]
MKILVFGGSGAIGRAVAHDLAQEKTVEAIGITGRRKNLLNATKARIGSEKIRVHALDVMDKKAVKALMGQYDAGALALPDRRTSYKLIESAMEAGFSIVDMLEEYHRRPDAYELEGMRLPKGISGLNKYGDWLHKTGVKTGATFVDGMGFAPGLSNVTVGEAIRKLDTVESAVARVGGVPNKEAARRHPLRYMITWAFEHVLREYMVKLFVRKNGKVVEVPALTDRERFRFNRLGVDEELVCAVTPGMPSFIYTRPQLKDFSEKTVRWPGHWEGVDTLKECGLLDLAPVKFAGKKIVPREFLLAMIRPRLAPQKGDTDVCVMYNTVLGTKNGRKTRIDYYMWDVADPKTGLSAMARVTGFPVALTAKYIAEGKITEKGIVAPEDAFTSDLYKRFQADLKKRNINILEEITAVED